MIVSVDGLTGFVDAIHAVFPLAEIQRCIVHQIRYSTKFISYKDIRAFMKDLKLVYKADTEQLALEALDMLEENWGGKYPSSIARPGVIIGRNFLHISNTLERLEN